jgi:sugar phosphate isomerase/epimerase
MSPFSRREFLQSVAGSGFFAAKTRAAHSFVPYIIGANTAIEGYGFFQAVALLQKLGFPTIEVQNLVGVLEPTPGAFPGFRLDRITEKDKRAIKTALASFRYVTAHLPYTGLEYFAPDGPVAESAIKTLELAMDAVAFLGAKIAVLHPKPGPGMSLDETWPLMIRRFRRWGDRARAGGFRLALETGYPRSVRDFVRLIQEIGHDHVGATIDVGHQSSYAELVSRIRPEERGTPKGIKAYNDTTIEIIDKLRSKILHFHVHDIEPNTWKEHQPLIYGFVDYPRLLRKLHEINYGGVLVFEIGAPASEMPGDLADAKRKLERYISES